MIWMFSTGVTDAGVTCHLYYAELDRATHIDEITMKPPLYMVPISSISFSMSCSNLMEICTNWSFLQCVLTVDEAEKLVKYEKDSLIFSSHYYALFWWFLEKHKYMLLWPMEATVSVYGVLWNPDMLQPGFGVDERIGVEIHHQEVTTKREELVQEKWRLVWPNVMPESECRYPPLRFIEALVSALQC